MYIGLSLALFTRVGAPPPVPGRVVSSSGREPLSRGGCFTPTRRPHHFTVPYGVRGPGGVGDVSRGGTCCYHSSPFTITTYIVTIGFLILKGGSSEKGRDFGGFCLLSPPHTHTTFPCGAPPNSNFDW